VDPSPGEPRTWLVDGFNVLNVALLRGESRREFWRAEARDRLLALADALAGSAGPDAPEVVVVFDGQHAAPPEDAHAARRVFAASADAWLLRAVREAPDPGAVAVVTADRQLADRARHRGARVVQPTDFVDRCRALALT